MSNPIKKEKIASIQIPNTMRTDLTGNKRKLTDHGSPRPCKKSNTDDGDDNKNKNTNDGDDNKKGKGFVNDGETHVCSVCQEVMSWNSIRAPALLVCGHVATCVSCYDTWNKGKLIKYCPICKIGQTIAPIRVDLGNTSTSKMNQYFQMDVTYIASVTLQRTPITISCTLSSTGEEIKSATVKILRDKKINYPEEFLKLIFRTQNKSYILHGNTTLYAIGFQKSLHTLFIQEDKLPINHKFIQERLKKMECSPNTKYTIRLRLRAAAKGLVIPDINMTVRKNHTIGILVERLNNYLLGKYYTTMVGKMVAVDIPRIGVMLEAKLTLEELKINTTSIVIFDVFD